MSPILVRPVREQFEHDRVIRVLQARYKRKYEVATNPGAEQNASINVGELAMYPDLVLCDPERARKVQATVEVETTESINTLEAMAEWGPFSRLRAAFFLYVPVSTIDNVRRLCAEHDIVPTEIWTYHAAMDQVRFTMVLRSAEAARAAEKGPRVLATFAVKPAEPVPAKVAAAAVPPAPAQSGATGATGGNGQPRPAPPPARPVEARPKPAKPKVAATSAAKEKEKERKPAPRTAKVAKAAKVAKKSTPKKLPRAAASRPRPAVKKTARKAASKRTATGKR